MRFLVTVKPPFAIGKEPVTLRELLRTDLIIHRAAQPSRDRAAAIPFLHFDVNALGTLHLLGAVRRASTILPNRPSTRFESDDPACEHGFLKSFPLIQVRIR